MFLNFCIVDGSCEERDLAMERQASIIRQDQERKVTKWRKRLDIDSSIEESTKEDD